MNLDRWLNSARMLRAPETETGAATAAASAAVAPAAAPAADAAPAAPAATAAPESSAAPAAPDAPAAQQSASSLLGAAEAKLPAKDATSDQGSADKPAEAATPATDATKPDAPKPETAETAAKDGAAAKDATAPATEALAAKPQARSYDAFKAPDGVRFDDKQIEGFTGLLENAELSHQDRAQKLIDMHVGELERVVKEQKDHQLKAWSDFTDGLKSDFKTSELGGNRQETSLGVAKYVLEQLGGNDAQQSDLIAMMNHTGMGNHVGLIRLLNNVYEKFLAEAKPVPGSAPTRAARGNFQDVMYGGPANGSGG